MSLKFDIEEGKKSGVYFSGTSGSGKTNAAKSVIKMLMEAGISCYIFDPSQAWLKSSITNIIVVSALPTDLVVNQSTVFDISRLLVSDQKIVVSDFCKGLFAHQVNLPEADRKWCFVFFEEAQIYLQQNSMRANSSAEVMRLITVGRNFKIRYGLITQFPSTIDKLPVKMTKQRYFGYTDEKNDVEYIRSFLGDQVEELKSLKLGEFIYNKGTTLEHVQFPEFKTDIQPSITESILLRQNNDGEAPKRAPNGRIYASDPMTIFLFVLGFILAVIVIGYILLH